MRGNEKSKVYVEMVNNTNVTTRVKKTISLRIFVIL
jgi:hypothetical protein